MSVFFSLSSLPLYKHLMERQRKTLPKYTLRIFRKINKSTPDKFGTKQDLMAQRTSVLFLNTAYPVTSITHTYIHTPTYALSWATAVGWMCYKEMNVPRTAPNHTSMKYLWSADSGTVYVCVIKINYVDRWTPDPPYFIDLLLLEMNSLSV